MKKIFVFCFFVMISLGILAQTKDSIKVNGSVTFQTQTNALVTGGRFSDKPALKGYLVFSKGNKSFSLTRNSDLFDSKSNANFSAAGFTFQKKFSERIKTSLTSEVFVFEANKSMDLFALSGVATYSFNKSFNTNLTSYYIYQPNGNNGYVVRLDFGKKVEKFGLEARIYGWYVDWNGRNYSAVAEVSKIFKKDWKLSVFQHWNKFTNKSSYAKFGVVRLAYNF